MGWKNVKEHYRIWFHLVHVTSEGICIGSEYAPNGMVISPTGELLKVDERDRHMRRYRSEMEADPAKLRELIEAPDQFRSSIPIFTFDGATILEKQCEDLGRANVTHDGLLMTRTRCSTDRVGAIALARLAAEQDIRDCTSAIDAATEQVRRLTLRRAQQQAVLAQLLKDYPANQELTNG